MLSNVRLVSVVDRSAILRWIGGAIHDNQTLIYRPLLSTNQLEERHHDPLFK